VENPALAQRCSNCSKAFPYPEDNQTLENVDREAFSKEGEKSERARASRTNVGGGPEAAAPGGGGVAAIRPQGENRKDSQVISKTPSGFGSSDTGSEGQVEERTIFGEEPSPATASGAQSGSGGRSAAAYSFSGILEPGMDFGPRFRIEKLLGEGGMGKVYKAFDKELGRTVALKTLQPELTKDPNVILRFKQELLLASKISHKHILRIHDLSEWEGVKFITMAFIEGHDLNQLLEGECPFPIDRSLKIARQLCEALDAAHSEGVVHRDFKPHNVLVGKNDHVYVSDFGLATSFETAKLGMTRTGAFVGTPRYMSPEQVEGKQIDSRSDLYSFGLVFYEMVAGEVPFAGESTWQVMYQRVKDPPRDIKSINPAIPDNVARIIMHCLEREPADRYQTAKEIIADIDAGRSPEISVTSMYRTPSSMGRSVQITLPAHPARWMYFAAGGLVLVATFFAIPKTRHFVFKPTAATTAVAAGANGLPSLAEGKFVAVLPFRVLGDPASFGYLADGLEDALSARLSQLEGLRVTSREVAQKADQKQPLPKLGRSLGANLLVQGMLQGTGDKVRISVNLEDVVNGKRLWSKEYDGVTGDLFTLEDEIYTQLVSALELNLTHEEQAKTATHPTDNVAAYELYLRGQNAFRGQDKKGIQRAIDYFNQALKQDRRFAPAYAGIADASLSMYDLEGDSSWMQKALAAAQQAELLNDNLPEVHTSLGAVYGKLGKTAEAVAELQRATALDPNSDLAFRRLATAYLGIGQSKQAIEAFQKAIQLNPYYWGSQNQLGSAYYNLGDYPKALEAFKQVTVLAPDNQMGYQNIGNVYLQEGKYQEAIPYFQKAIQIEPNMANYTNLGSAYFFLKQYANSVEAFEKAVEFNPNDATLAVNLADGYRAAGQQDKARAAYEKAISTGFKQLQTNPQDAAVVDQIALAFAKTGKAHEAENFSRRARAIDKNNVSYVYDQARIQAVLGQTSQALQTLQQALDQQFPCEYAQGDPDLEVLRGTPQFQAMIKKCSAAKR
jgi:tetratricopeptide (TPR) repeat protein/TolB-like protein/predicted Ser/Thr protein kinase